MSPLSDVSELATSLFVCVVPCLIPGCRGKLFRVSKMGNWSGSVSKQPASLGTAGDGVGGGRKPLGCRRGPEAQQKACAGLLESGERRRGLPQSPGPGFSKVGQAVAVSPKSSLGTLRASDPGDMGLL